MIRQLRIARDLLAINAREVLRGRVEVQALGHDRYGRTLARVSVGGRDAGDQLIRLGLARRWM